MVPWTVKKVRHFDSDKFVHELVDFHHRRPLPGAGPHAGAQRAGCARVPAVGDVRNPRPKGTFKIYAVEGGTAAMCYIFKVAEEQPDSSIPGDTIALGVPIFTPIHRDGAPGGLRPSFRRGASEAGEPVSVPG
jgi:aspartate 4-decarboxylase